MTHRRGREVMPIVYRERVRVGQFGEPTLSQRFSRAQLDDGRDDAKGRAEVEARNTMIARRSMGTKSPVADGDWS